MELQTLHRSTFQRVSDHLYSTSVVFADGRRALVADNSQYCQRLYFVGTSVKYLDLRTLPYP